MAMTNELHPEVARLVVVTGLSGSGISTAINALEDIGYFCVDNLPPPLLTKLMALARSTEKFSRLAIGLDARNVGNVEQTIRLLDLVKSQGVAIEMIFLEASPDVLRRRFDVGRRPHPLARLELDLIDAIREETTGMQPLRENANFLIDTSALNVHDCKRLVQEFVHEDAGVSLLVTLTSFGFRYGTPVDANIVWDVRFLPNPYFDLTLRSMTGLDALIQTYVFDQPATLKFYDPFLEMIKSGLPSYKKEGKRNLTIALGCTGGKHRSVSLIERLANDLRGSGEDVRVRHRDLGQE
jgi:UPF0042 nucleotide-binding protein